MHSAQAQESGDGFDFDSEDVASDLAGTDSGEISFEDSEGMTFEEEDTSISSEDTDDSGISEDESNESDVPKYDTDRRLSQRYQNWNDNHPNTLHSSAKFYQYTDEATTSSYVITSDDIQAHGFRTLADILRHIPGIQTQMGDSQFQIISMRGLLSPSNDRSRILWFLNDAPLNDAHNGQVFIDETFPVDLIRRIEINIGPQSALYGPGAFLGTIHIYTKTPSDIDKYGEYRITMQNNLTFKGSATAGYLSESKNFGILGHISGGTTQGSGLVADSVYRTYLMEQAEQSIIHGNLPDNIRRNQLDNNGQKHWYHLFMNMHFYDFKFNVGFSDIYAKADGSEITPYMKYGDLQYLSENQLSGTDSAILSKPVPTDSYHFNRRYVYTDLNYQHTFDANISLNTQISYHLIQYRHENYHGLSGVQDDSVVSTDFNTLEHHLDFTSDILAKFGESNYFSGGLSLRFQYFSLDDLTHNSDVQVDSSDKKILTPAIWLRDEQHLWEDRIILNAGIRYDAWQALDNIQHDISWQAGFLGKFHRAFGTKINYSYAMNEPTFYELDEFIKTESSKSSNLDKETIHHVELDFLITPIDSLSMTIGGYYSNIKNLILYNYQSDRSDETKQRLAPHNDSDANIYGSELNITANINNSWQLYGYYNFLYSQRKEHDINPSVITDKRFKDDSMHRLKLGFTYTNEFLCADLATFLVAGTPDTVSEYNRYRDKDFWRSSYHIPLYFIIQPSISVKLPANFGIAIHGSYAFSEDMAQSPSYRFYYEKEGLPVNRYSFLFSLMYPYQK